MTNRQSIHRKLFISLLLCTALGGSGFLTACSSSSENEQHKRITAAESSIAAVVDTNNTENSKTGEASVPDTYENTSVEKPLLAFADEDTDTSYDTESAAAISFSGSNANIGGSDFGRTVAFKHFACVRFGKKFKLGHFIGAEKASLAIGGELFKELPTKSSFATSRSGTDNVETRRKDLKTVDVVKAGFSIGIFERVTKF